MNPNDINLDQCLATLPGPWAGGPCFSGFVGRSISMALAGWIFGIVFYRFMKRRVIFPVSTMTILLTLLGGALISGPLFSELVPLALMEFVGSSALIESQKITFALMVAAQCVAVLIAGAKGGLTTPRRPVASQLPESVMKSDKGTSKKR